MFRRVKVQVGIVGGGPAGLLLSQLLGQAGISSAIVEIRSEQYVERRVRAGQMEPATVKVFVHAGVGERLQTEGLQHEGMSFIYNDQTHRIDFYQATGQAITIYGQQEIVKDLIKARRNAGALIYFSATEVAIHEVESRQPRITFTTGDTGHQIDCDFIAGCDGFHGVSRRAIGKHLSVYEHDYKLSWLGILAESAPISNELVYSVHDSGFALYSMRSPRLSRLYLQCAPADTIEDWPDERIWSELRKRLMSRSHELKDGAIREKGIIQLRSFMVDPVQYGALFLAGDAAHIVPPSAAKGLNAAVADVTILSRAFEAWFNFGDMQLLRNYSQTVIPRAWESQRFSHWMTKVLHQHHTGQFERLIQLRDLQRIFESPTASADFADAYVGGCRNLPFVDSPNFVPVRSR